MDKIMKRIIKNKLKKDYLTKEEIDAIIIAAMNSFREESLIEGLSFNYLSMEHSFINSLGILCIENFDDESRDAIYNEGLIDEFIDSIKNARYTYNLLNKIADKAINSLEGVMSKLTNFTDENYNMEDLQKAIPEINEVFQKYDNIINPNIEETK